jgi:hypothetical protein
MKKYVLLGLVLVLIPIFTQACVPNIAAEPNPAAPENVPAEDLRGLTPVVTTETQDPASIGTPMVFMYPYSIPRLHEFVPGPMLDAGDLLLATPLYPNFVINSARLFECDGIVYIVIEVTNRGPYYFQYISLGVSHGSEWAGVTHAEDPWIFYDSACPLSSFQAFPSLGPGYTAYIYQEVNPDPAHTAYTIHLTMCAYLDAPDPCQYRTYLHEEAWPTPTIAIMGPPYIELIELSLCWVGPGPPYEVVRSIPEGAEVELLGIGDVEDFLIVLEPFYQRECWLKMGSANEVPEEVLRELTLYYAPPLPTGAVAGRVFRDNDNSGGFNSGDAGYPGAQVNLAAGSCSSPGRAVTATTDNDGRYYFPDLTPGTYCLTAVKPTTCKVFTTPGSYEITVPGGSTVEKNFGMDGCR